MGPPLTTALVVKAGMVSIKALVIRHMSDTDGYWFLHIPSSVESSSIQAVLGIFFSMLGTVFFDTLGRVFSSELTPVYCGRLISVGALPSNTCRLIGARVSVALLAPPPLLFSSSSNSALPRAAVDGLWFPNNCVRAANSELNSLLNSLLIAGRFSCRTSAVLKSRPSNSLRCLNVLSMIVGADFPVTSCKAVNGWP